MLEPGGSDPFLLLGTDDLDATVGAGMVFVNKKLIRTVR